MKIEPALCNRNSIMNRNAIEIKATPTFVH